LRLGGWESGGLTGLVLVIITGFVFGRREVVDGAMIWIAYLPVGRLGSPEEVASLVGLALL
jgi:hypothetical protein